MLWLKDSNLRRGATQFGSWDRRYTCITIISLIMMEYPSRSNLKCFFSFTRSSAQGDEFRFHSGLSTSVEWGKPLSIVVRRGIEPLYRELPVATTFHRNPTDLVPNLTILSRVWRMLVLWLFPSANSRFSLLSSQDRIRTCNTGLTTNVVASIHSATWLFKKETFPLRSP